MEPDSGEDALREASQVRAFFEDEGDKHLEHPSNCVGGLGVAPRVHA